MNRFTEESAAELTEAMLAHANGGYAEDDEPDCACVPVSENEADATECRVHNPRRRRRENPHARLMAAGREAEYAAMERRF